MFLDVSVGNLLIHGSANSWARVSTWSEIVWALINRHRIGYKVGRVDQSETALGAEMRLAADKKGKAKSSEDKAKDKIVQRYAMLNWPCRSKRTKHHTAS